MKKRWTLFGITVVMVAFVGLWLNVKRNPPCENCSKKERPYFQVFSTPTLDHEARERKFLSFTQQSYPYFRVAVCEEESKWPDVQAVMEKFPHLFAKLPDGYRAQELIYRWIHSIPPTDIVVLFPPEEALEPLALERLSALYAGSAAWLAFQGNVKQWARDGILTGYATLFQKIKLQDFLEHGSFSENKEPETRLFELAGRHVRRLRGNFIEGKSYGYTWIARSRKPYPRLKQGQENPVPTSDLVVFSFDRPLQLYALLESTEKFVTSLDQISVVYRVSTPAFDNGYERVKKQFPHVRFLKQGERYGEDFKPLLLQAAFHTSSPYIIFAVDDMIVKDSMDIREGIEQMEETGALGVYYRLGRHLNFSYMQNQPQAVPPSIPLGKKMWAWQFSSAEGDWRYPHTVDMTLYRKEDIKQFLISLNYTNPNSLESKWALKAKTGGVGIYYETSKAVNIPLNLVNLSQNRHMSQYTTEELLTMFLGG